MPIICKHCGAEDGFYVKERVTGVAVIFYNDNGDYEEDQGDMYESLTHSGGKKAYCQSCTKYMGKREELISEKNDSGTQSD